MGTILLGLIVISGIAFFEENNHWLMGGLFFAAGFAAVSYLFHSASQMRLKTERSAAKRSLIQRRNVVVGVAVALAGVISFILAQAQLTGVGAEGPPTLPAQLGFSVTVAGFVWTLFAVRQ